ncbi:DNA translocase FtsK 4TM domain-containing protein [Myxococcus sp. CA005]|uniref:FtsK/SpoIIIE family DNA translocase n=1 Tax=Myxococcus sp. CA005 TaxID=2562800 RepID=UPI0018913839|nr:DNA translocase FtsK 4TM domain-containing protein [Myxococcus sp. CA005]
MTAKKGRAEKAVLSRQEIATRRRALADKRMKAGKGGDVTTRAITGVFLLAASLIALLAVATFDAKDRVGPGFNNAVGPMGHLIAESLRGLLGVCAYLIPAGGIYTAMVLFVGSRDRKRGPQIISLALLTVSVSVLAQLMFAGDKGWAHPPGGALGASLGGIMSGLFSTVGTVILVTAISAAALIVGTQYTFLKLCSLAWAGLCVVGRRVQESASVFWEAQKVAYQERQERAAEEKLEEAAFLAQLEADEEELAEAERLAEEAEAAEAEAMAEEAFRLSKQQEKEQAIAAKLALKESREREKAEKLRAKLADFGIVGEVVEIRPGPVVTMYEFLPGPGIKVSKIAALADDLAMAMEAMRVRIVAPIPGKGVVGIEVPNRDRETVYLKEIAEQDAFNKGASKLTMCVGKDIEGMPYVLDLAKAPHLLIAGTTGSGKSVAVNSMIMSILLKATPEEVRFIMVDPKMLELSVYEGIPHLLLPVVTDPKKAALALRWAVEEMERRYQMLSEAGVRNIAGFNKLVESTAVEVKTTTESAPKKKAKPKNVLVLDGESPKSSMPAGGESLGVAAPRDDEDDMLDAQAPEEAEAPELEDESEDTEAMEASESTEPEKKQLKKLPYIVVIIDELADLMMVASREVETYVARLAQMARAAGIHLMVATQRPSTDVVTGVIKANFPTRVSFMLRSKPDSMTILGTVGAEALLGMGDMLIMPPTSAHLQRVHGAFVSENEIKKAVDHLKAQGKPVYDDSILKPRDEDVEGGGEEDELSDELYDQALATVSEMRAVSISMLQRKMRIGYNRAARMIERMERDGVVGAADGAKPREVLIRGLGDMPGAGAM